MHTKQHAAENKAMFEHARAFLRTHNRTDGAGIHFTYAHELAAGMARKWPGVSVERIATQIYKAERVVRGEIYRSQKD